MRRVSAYAALLAGILVLGAGCQSATGRTAGQWTDDKATTAKVKTALAATRLSTLTRVDVDTVGGVVYLHGRVDSEDTRRRAEDVARNAAKRRVVNELTLDTVPAASPRSR